MSVADKLLQYPILSWPATTAAALVEEFETKLAGQAAFVRLPLKARSSLETEIQAFVADLTSVIISLFPAWLPEGKSIELQGAGAFAAIRSVANAVSGSTHLFRPFLIRVAETAVDKRKKPDLQGFSQELVLRECAKLLSRAYGVPNLVVILTPIGELNTAAVERLERVAIWAREQGGFLIWVTGPFAAQMARIPRFEQFSSASLLPLPVQAEDVSYITPLTGRPNPLSLAECRLEARLASLSWSAGRAWNKPWSLDTLHNHIRVDLMWEQEKLVIEIDGVDHLDPVKFAADRHRDRLLQVAGFSVFRFTNEEVLNDIEKVASFLGRVVEDKRRHLSEGGSFDIRTS